MGNVCEKVGKYMKDNEKITKCMGLESLNGRMEGCMKASTKMT